MKALWKGSLDSCRLKRVGISSIQKDIAPKWPQDVMGGKTGIEIAADIPFFFYRACHF